MRKILFTIIVLTSTFHLFGKEYPVFSPDGNTALIVNVDNGISLTINFDSEHLFSVDNIALNIGGIDFENSTKKVRKVNINTINQVIYPEVREKYKEIEDKYQELVLDFRGDISLIFRVYNDGVAYRFNTDFKDSIIIEKENIHFRFDEDDIAYLQRSKSFRSPYETPYEHGFLKDMSTDGYCNLPFLVKKRNGMNVLIAESDLVNYPGLWLKTTGTPVLRSVHPGYPLSYDTDGSAYGRGQVTKHADYIAKVNGSGSLPWRVFVIAENDAALLTNNLVYQLATPSKIQDVSWITPGVVAFDWWGKHNIYGTDFRSGINTETAKYFIDFCADYGFEYFLFDDGWTSQDDMLAVNKDLDMEQVMAYAKTKDVKIMVWAIWNTFLEKEEEAWEQFEKWGISGIKFDFMNRDDQEMVQFYHHVAQEAAKRKMIIDFHGAYKPAGLRRIFPNVLTREALIEFEYNGWTDYDTPEHHNLLPYIRMVTGPMDYIPFTTQNVQKDFFYNNPAMPQGMGTRAHSMALFVILASPLQMLPDSPSDYYREHECTQFISKVPVVWDDLEVLEAKIGEYTSLARRNGDDWYIAAITNWDKRAFNINLDFLPDGNYKMEFIEDGVNADKRAIDYRKNERIVNSSDTIAINLAPGGGWIARLIKIN